MKRYFWILLTMLFICCLSIGCGETESVETEESDTEEVLVIPDHQTIRIMCNDSSKDYIESLASGFTARNEDVTVDIIYVEGVQSATYTERLALELGAQDGPDVILLNPVILSLDDINLVKGGGLADINALNDMYHYMDWGEYATDIIDVGVFDGKRMILPAFYTVPILVGVKEVLDRENIAYGEGVTFPAFVESLSSCQTADFHNPVLAINMYRYCGLDVIDEYGSRGDLSVDALRSFVESYDKLFPDIYNGRYRDYVVSNSAYDNSQCGALLAGDELFFNPKPDYPDRCFLVYLDGILSAITEAGGTPVVTHMPTMTGQGVAGALGWSFAVSATTEAPEAALRFLKYALSFEAQCEDTRTRGIPVNNAYMEAVKAWYYGRAINFLEGNSMSNFQFYIDPVDRSILDAYFDILSAVYIPRYISNNAVCYIQNVIVDVSKDKMTVSAAIEKEQIALEEYLKQ